ncbi:MAG: methyltransferase [Myxococcota bacterium]
MQANEDIPSMPPRWLLRVGFALRRALRDLHDRLVPAPVALLERSMGVGRTALLGSVARLGVADRLEAGPATAETLARAAGVDADALERVLRALVADGVFARDREGRYRNNRLSRGLLVTTPGGGPWMCAFSGAACNLHAWAALDHTVATGRSAFEHVHGRSVWAWCDDHPEDGETFAVGMQRMTALSVGAIADGGDFGRFGTVCDVAGGQGLLLAAILRRHPAVLGVLTDRHAVLAGAGPLLDRHGVSDRCALVPVDMFVLLPDAADAYVLKDILHDWDDAAAGRILATVRRACPDGGRVVVVEMLAEPDAPDPIVTFTDVLMMTCASDGRQRTLGELDALLAGAGFERARLAPLNGIYTLVEAVAR